MSNLCIIPARGGSKRIPRKNIRDFLGKPIIAYSIEVAMNSGLFDEIMVSTDDQEIASIATNFCAKVPFLRSDKTANDFASTVDVLIEVITNYINKGILFDNACCLYPTAPLIKSTHLHKGFELLRSEKVDSVFPITSFSYPIWRGLRFGKENKIKMVWPEHLNSRSQDLEEVFHDAGQWYWFSVAGLLRNKKLFTDNSSAVVLEPTEVQDIDTLHDWKIAELKYAYLQSIK